MAHYAVTLIDHQNEKSTARFPGTELTSGNIVAQLALTAALDSARAGITEGTQKRSYVQTAEADGSAAIPSAPSAAIEKKWLVTYVDDNTGETHRVKNPTAKHNIPLR